jgi:hypothetical protein
LQRFSQRIKGWNYPIVENPQPGQYRYIRFAWKKVGGTGIMVQLCREGTGWEQRYVAGNPSVPWAARKVADKMPEEWELVTRDLFKDFGTFTLTGMAFTPMDGTAGLYDHVYLGGNIEDLDRVTNAALGKAPPKEELTPEKLQQLWKDLASPDALVSVPASASLIAGPKESIPFLAKQLEGAPLTDDEKRIAKLVKDLDDDDFFVRERASADLTKMGAIAVPPLQKALKETGSVEVARRITAILGKEVLDDTGPSPEFRHKLQAIRVVERVSSSEARQALARLAQGPLEAGLRSEIKLSLARLAKRPLESRSN